MGNPLALLLSVGILLAANLALVKVAAGAGVPPLVSAVASTLGAGNVVRSRDWPAKATPIDVAPRLLIGAGALLAAMLPFQAAAGALTASALGMPALILAVTTLFYTFYFRLQHLAGAVYLSQIGCVAAVIGLLIGVTRFDEPFDGVMLAGLGLVVVGILMVQPAHGKISARLAARPASANVKEIAA